MNNIFLPTHSLPFGALMCKKINISARPTTPPRLTLNLTTFHRLSWTTPPLLKVICTSKSTKHDDYPSEEFMSELQEEILYIQVLWLVEEKCLPSRVAGILSAFNLETFPPEGKIMISDLSRLLKEEGHEHPDMFAVRQFLYESFQVSRDLYISCPEGEIYLISCLRMLKRKTSSMVTQIKTFLDVLADEHAQVEELISSAIHEADSLAEVQMGIKSSPDWTRTKTLFMEGFVKYLGLVVTSDNETTIFLSVIRHTVSLNNTVMKILDFAKSTLEIDLEHAYFDTDDANLALALARDSLMYINPERVTSFTMETRFKMVIFGLHHSAKSWDVGRREFEKGPHPKICPASIEERHIDPADEYVKLMRSMFDFDSIRKLISLLKFKLCFDKFGGIMGACAKRIFMEGLGCNENCLLHYDQKGLLAHLGFGKSSSEIEPPEFAACLDCREDPIWSLGRDSVAIITANAVEAIPYFSGGLKGVARSMPTSAALDIVAKELKLKFFEVPSGWKFFVNLMDAGLCSICGDESYVTGSDHRREKDGIWAVLAWLSILACKNKANLDGEKLVSVEDIVRSHWITYGRHYYTRYEYENVDVGEANELMANLVKVQLSLDEVNRIVKETRSDVATVIYADEFEYKNPVDGSISQHHGVRYLFEDGSRLVFRLSGAGSGGATIWMYIEQYEKEPSKTRRSSQDVLAPLVEVALKLSKMQEFTGRSAPTFIAF